MDDGGSISTTQRQVELDLDVVDVERTGRRPCLPEAAADRDGEDQGDGES